MHRFKLLLILWAFTSSLLAQEDVSLDILRAPSSPASNLLGITASDIQNISDPADFMVSLQNASDNFSALPKSYAVDFAPAWVFTGSKLDYENFKATDLKSSLWQTLVASVATNTVQDDDNAETDLTQLAFGIRASLIRGNIAEDVDSLVRKSTELLDEMVRRLQPRVTQALEVDDSLSIYKTRRRALRDSGQQNTPAYEKVQKQIESRTTTVVDMVETSLQSELSGFKAQLSKLVQNIKYRRVGFKLDLAGGIVFDFPGQNFSEGAVSKAGVWLTGGYELLDGVTALSIARYLVNPDQVFADDSGMLSMDNVQTFDAGLRFIYNKPGSSFALSLESIYRSVLNVSELSSSWRLDVNASYDVGQNKKLILVFGRDFDGTVTTDGNVIAALNLVLGFGSKRGVTL